MRRRAQSRVNGLDLRISLAWLQTERRSRAHRANVDLTFHLQFDG
jgi:hypothetical protein